MIPTVTIAMAVETPRAGRRRARTRTRGSVLPFVGVALIASMLLFVLIVPLLPGFDPLAQDLSRARLLPFADPAHPLGTDAIGRDSLSRLAEGGRTTMLIALAIVAINLVLGVTMGLCAGFFGGWMDSFITLVSEVNLAMPVVLLLIAIASIVGPSALLMVIVLGCTFWMGYARVARATAMSLRDRDFVLAPQMLGAGAGWTIRKHILPHVVPQMLILAVTDIGVVMLIQAGLDYLGLGVQPPSPTWGGLILEGQKTLRIDPWPAVLPGLAIFLVVVGIQFLSQKFTAEGSLPLRKVR
ncbi:ABC transporter permease [Microterricola viridarii]|uniref:Peptide/nickel transport system permease protein n=1 Tax=Microterricola viridarii TaxID=412690 RepID=A0A1H1ZHN3_9MICO|nr:ABC transporter permease [Microterricola viridarii]SDT33067.1 peptide/nickel transport system permease protein [Microterricola viridarii]